MKARRMFYSTANTSLHEEHIHKLELANIMLSFITKSAYFSMFKKNIIIIDLIN